MFRLLLFSPCLSRLHVRGVLVVPEHTRSIQRGNYDWSVLLCMM